MYSPTETTTLAETGGGGEQRRQFLFFNGFDNFSRPAAITESLFYKTRETKKSIMIALDIMMNYIFV